MKLHEHLDKIIHFAEVAKQGSMKQAAEGLYLTQPSLSKSIRVLEDAVGEKLFVREQRGVTLTEAGTVLLEYSQQILSQVSEFEHKMKKNFDPLSGKVRIGTYDSIGVYFWPRFLRGFMRRYPKIDVEFTTGRSFEMNQLLRYGEIDLTLTVEPKATAGLHVEPLKVDSFSCYQSNKLRQEDKYSTPLIAMPEALTSHGPVIKTLVASGCQIHRTSSLEVVKEMTLQGLGVGVLPSMVARKLVEQNKLRAMKHPALSKKSFGEHKIGLMYPKNLTTQKIFSLLIDEVKSQFT